MFGLLENNKLKVSEWHLAGDIITASGSRRCAPTRQLDGSSTLFVMTHAVQACRGRIDVRAL